VERCLASKARRLYALIIMAKSKTSEARQIEQLLLEKLIPLAQEGAPFVLFDTPPRSSIPLNIREEATEPLAMPKQKKPYPQFYVWPREHVNSVSVPMIGCIFEGEADYDVRNPPGREGRRWIVPVRQNTLYVISPGIPFSANKLHWERSHPHQAYARGIQMHLRHDGISCHTYSMNKGRMWSHPYLFFYEFEAHLLGERLLKELHRSGKIAEPIIRYYLLLIFHLMARCIREERFSSVRGILGASSFVEDDVLLAANPHFAEWVRSAQEYINENLADPGLSCQQIALHTGLSLRHLNRLFKQEIKMPIFQYVQQKRLEKACALLENPGTSIGQTAQYCGFRQSSHFSAWFSRHTQRSPRSYKMDKKQ